MLPDCPKDENDFYWYEMLIFILLGKFYLYSLDSHKLLHTALCFWFTLNYHPFFLPIQKRAKCEKTLDSQV